MQGSSFDQRPKTQSFKVVQGIDNLTWIHQNIADGPTEQRWKDGGVFAFERLGGAHLLVGLNKDAGAARTITVDTGFGAHTGLHDYTGHAGDVTTDQNGRLTLTIPHNVDGLGYVCYSRAGIAGTFAPKPQAATQVYEGARDLDIKPADNEAAVRVCRVWASANSRIDASLEFDDTDWTDATTIVVALEGPKGANLSNVVYTRAVRNPLTGATTEEGWHTFWIRSNNTPPSNEKPSYKLTVTYTAPAFSTALFANV